jgi:hypothetical protein
MNGNNIASPSSHADVDDASTRSNDVSILSDNSTSSRISLVLSQAKSILLGQAPSAILELDEEWIWILMKELEGPKSTH